jgi:hypothetical protein
VSQYNPDFQTIDDLIDAGFPALTEVDIDDTTYHHEGYLTASVDGITFGLSERIFDVVPTEHRYNQNSPREYSNRQKILSCL